MNQRRLAWTICGHLGRDHHRRGCSWTRRAAPARHRRVRLRGVRGAPLLDRRGADHLAAIVEPRRPAVRLGRAPRRDPCDVSSQARYALRWPSTAGPAIPRSVGSGSGRVGFAAMFGSPPAAPLPALPDRQPPSPTVGLGRPRPAWSRTARRVHRRSCFTPGSVQRLARRTGSSYENPIGVDALAGSRPIVIDGGRLSLVVIGAARPVFAVRQRYRRADRRRAPADEMAGVRRRLPRDLSSCSMLRCWSRSRRSSAIEARRLRASRSSRSSSLRLPRHPDGVPASRSCGTVCGTSTSSSGRPCSTGSSSPGSCSSSGSSSSWRRSW